MFYRLSKVTKCRIEKGLRLQFVFFSEQNPKKMARDNIEATHNLKLNVKEREEEKNLIQTVHMIQSI
jgi:hypothetical protein